MKIRLNRPKNKTLIRAMVKVTNPKLGETIYDGACGSAGFLCESHDYLRHGTKELTTSELKELQEKTFYGKEKKSLAYIIGIMNMILEKVLRPNNLQILDTLLNTIIQVVI